MNRPDPWGVVDCLPGAPTAIPVEYPNRPAAAAAAGRSRRGWEAAVTDRLNYAHWENVSTQPINDDLIADLQTLQERARYEAQNNGLVEGAIETHATDCVGDNGPALQMLTDDRDWNESVEQLFRDWSRACEFQHGLALADLLHGWVSQLWTDGEFLAQEIIGRSALDYQILDLGASRLSSPGMSTATTVLGVEIDGFGRPQQYWITDPQRTGTTQRRSIPAAFICHAFRRRFPGQLRGIPILAAGLQPIGDLRDYDTQVMDAARAVADQAVWMISQHPDAPFLDVDPDTTAQIQRRTVRHAPPGWEPRTLDPRHPAANYLDFRRERQREVGSAAQMPLLVLRQDASQHSYSSARFDSIRYVRAVSRTQAWLGRRTLDRFLRRLVRLGRLDGSLPPAGGRLSYRWTWPKAPHVDPEREASAERLRLENGTLSLSDAAAAYGLRIDDLIADRARVNAMLVDAGLPPIVGAIPSDYQPGADPYTDDDPATPAGAPSDDETNPETY